MAANGYLIVSALLFAIGVVGVLARRNPLVMFMSIELMLNAVNLSFMTFAHFLNSVDGWMFVFLVLDRRGGRGRRRARDHRLDLPGSPRHRRGRAELAQGLVLLC